MREFQMEYTVSNDRVICADEAVVAADKVAAVQLLAACKIPKVRQFITRRMATGRDAGKKE